MTSTPDPIDDALGKMEAELNQPPVVGVVIDKSGSMQSLQKETIQGFNEFLQEQQRHDVRLLVTMFDTTVDMRPIEHVTHVAPLDMMTYQPDGMTALLDAIGVTIAEMDKHPAARRVIAIITDGHENASREYTLADIKKKIEDRQKQDWDFMFLGAGLDVVQQAGDMGIPSTHAAAYSGTAMGTQSAYVTTASAVTRAHSAAPGKTFGGFTDEELQQLQDEGDQ